ncbi:hypothetical protein FB451DRAFT_1342006 [Mycena latifolia]|nr:hypothetical protein FB451DRAFT_1342006 [Mycena latifolia]
MNKSQFYLSQCVDAASKSTMYYRLGSVLHQVISQGFNHQRPNYEAPRNGLPLSMHAEMACIFNATRGFAPALKQQCSQVQPGKCTATPKTTRNRDSATTKPAKRTAASGGAAQGVRAAASLESCSLPGEEEAGGRDISGSTLYVCRVTKDGFGCSKPCWRCVDWCEWAGIKRIFYWSVVEGRFLCLKVGAPSGESYQTIADTRMTRERGPLP